MWDAYEQFGDRFDGLINNAGTDRGAGILELTDEQYTRWSPSTSRARCT